MSVIWDDTIDTLYKYVMIILRKTIHLSLKTLI